MKKQMVCIDVCAPPMSSIDFATEMDGVYCALWALSHYIRVDRVILVLLGVPGQTSFIADHDVLVAQLGTRFAWHLGQGHCQGDDPYLQPVIDYAESQDVDYIWNVVGNYVEEFCIENDSSKRLANSFVS